MAPPAWCSDALNVLALRAGRPLAANREVSWVLLTGRHATVLIPSDDIGPLGVLRLWRDAALGMSKHGKLEAVNRCETESVRSTLPQPLLTRRIGRHLLTAETFLPGRPMQPAGRSRLGFHARARASFAAVRAWMLERLVHVSAGAADFELAEMIPRLVDRFEASGPARLMLERLVTRWPALGPEGVVHNDFRPEHIFLQSGKVSGVVDWEYAQRGPLLADWFAFLVNCRFAGASPTPSDRRWVLEQLDETFLADSRFVAVVREETHALMAEARIGGDAAASAWSLAAVKVHPRQDGRRTARS